MRPALRGCAAPPRPRRPTATLPLAVALRHYPTLQYSCSCVVVGIGMALAKRWYSTARQLQYHLSITGHTCLMTLQVRAVERCAWYLVT